MKRIKVYPAMPYNSGLLNIRKGFAYMFVRQFNFPNIFDSELDKYESVDNDILREKDCEKHNSCFKTHTGTGESGFDSWIEKSSDEAILNFLKDILEVDLTVTWTGYRILVSRNSSTGYKIWTLETFSKHPDSNTREYTGEKAPNVKNGYNQSKN